MEGKMEAIELAVGGEVVSQIYQDTRRFGIHVRFQEDFRNDVDVLEGILIHRMNNTLIPLREVASVESVLGPVQINREHNQRRWTINANIRGRDLGHVVADIRAEIAENISLPPGYTLEIGGQFENQERAMRRLSIVIPIVLILIFVFLLIALDSAKEAARIRLRPILMTAFAFIVGLMPLVLASGAGANSRQSLGTAVVGGLTLATILIIFVPIFYVVIERFRERKSS